MSAQTYIQKFDMAPHPEGGYFKEIYRSDENISHHSLPARFSGARSFSTAIYFLLEQGDKSHLHRIQSDEMWHFYAGDPLEIIQISPDGVLERVILENKTHFTHIVPAGYWFGSRSQGAFSLVGCTVAPGFDFADFEMAKKADLSKQYPQHKKIIGEMSLD